MIKTRREAIKLLGGALGTLGTASLFADENSANSAGSEAQNLNEQNSINFTGQNSAENSSGDPASLYLRPPGALAERGFRSSCIKCGQCVQVCPYHSIYLLDITHLFDIGTPVIDAKERGCYLCGALPCVLACPSGALSHETNEPKKVKMGIAVIENLDACLAYRGQTLKSSDLRLKPAKTEQERELNSALAAKEGKPCDLCASLCPYPQPLDAIAMIEAGKHFAPQIRSACVGCGACAELCPARIIEIIPRADYKSIYEGKQ
nr:4Fe-4S dicluster domain-containing protein [uncultured Campylobacter sp.]